MADGSGEGGERHNEDAGSHGGLQFKSKDGSQDQEHHHTSARPDKAADEADDGSADDGLDEPLLRVCRFHGFSGSHDGLYDEFNAQKQRHEDREAAHGGARDQAGYPAAHNGENENGYHHGNAVFDVQVLVFPVCVCADRACQHITGEGDAHRMVGLHVKKRNEHGTDDSRCAHACEAGTKPGADTCHKADEKGV